jgi:hypothetical protein
MGITVEDIMRLVNSQFSTGATILSDQPDITALLQLGSVHGWMPLSFWKRMRRLFKRG